MFLTLDIVKRYNILGSLSDDSVAAEEPLVLLAMESACAEVCGMLQRSEDDMIAEYGEMPSDVVMAALMLTGYYYNNRDGERSEVPMRVRAMLQRYRRFPRVSREE